MKTVKIKDIAQVEMGLSPKGESYNFDGNGLPLLNGPTEFGTIYPNCTLYTTDSKRESEVNDLIFCVRGSTTGKMNFSDKKYSLGRGVCAIRGKNYIVTKYIKYALDKYLKSLLQFANGGTFPNLCRDDILNFEIPFNNHEKVVKFLSNYDDLIENNNRRIKILEEMAQKIYKEWFVDFKFPGHETTTFKDSPLGKIPNDWEVGKLQDIVEFFNGYAFKSKELLKHPQKNSLSVFKQGHINRGGGFNYSGTKSWFPREKSIELKKYILKKGDLLMAMTDMKNNVAILGNTAIMPMDNSYILNQRVGLLRCKNNLNISYPYVYMVTNSEPFLLNLRSRANSGVQVNLSTEQIKLSKLIIPASHINKLFNELITPIFEQIFLINKKNENLKQTRDILLPRLISGEINVENMEVL